MRRRQRDFGETNKALQSRSAVAVDQPRQHDEFSRSKRVIVEATVGSTRRDARKNEQSTERIAHEFRKLFPGVAADRRTCRLRVALSAAHRDQDVDALCEALAGL